MDQSGDSPDIPIVRMGESIAEVSDRWRVIKKMDMVPQYAFAGDHTGKPYRHPYSWAFMTRRLSRGHREVRRNSSQVRRRRALCCRHYRRQLLSLPARE